MTKSIIIIDIRTWAWTGIGRVTRGIFECGLQLSAEFEIFYIVNGDNPATANSPNCIRFRSRPFGFIEQIEFYLLLRRFRNRHIIFHSLNFNVPLLLGRRVSQIVHFYDVLTDTGEFRTPLHRLAYNIYVSSLRRHKATILAQSEYTAQQIAKHHPFYKVIVCPPGYDNYLEKRVINVEEVYGLSRPYFLYVGLNKPRKNLIGFIQAYSEVLKKYISVNYDLVICGPGLKRSSLGLDIRTLMQNEPILEKRVHFLGFIPEEHLHSLYSNAAMYVVPSNLESGFSYPALEALTVGTPVLLNKVDMFSFETSCKGVLFFNGGESLSVVLEKLLISQNIERVFPDECELLTRFNWGRVMNTMKKLYSIR